MPTNPVWYIGKTNKRRKGHLADLFPQVCQVYKAAESMSKAQALDLLMRAKRLLLIKSNVLASLVNVNLGKDVSVACGERLSKPP